MRLRSVEGRQAIGDRTGDQLDDERDDEKPADGRIDERIVDQAAVLWETAARVVLAISGDRALAEDCAQEAVLRAWRHQIDTGEHLRSLEAWTVRTALNLARSQHRRRGAESRALRRLAARPSAPPVDVALAADRILTDDLREAILALAPRQREVIVLHYLLDMGIAAIADATGITDGAVKNALFNGRAALADRLGARLAAKEET